MDQLQDELDGEFPNLGIEIIGVNELGQESANDLMTNGRDLPWLQDVDTNNNGESDVWDEQWNAEWRDVILVDSDGVRRGDYNLTPNDLGNSANYELLKSTAVSLAMENPIWQNDADPLDVNNDSAISPVGDVLSLINELNDPVYSDAAGNLPVPAASGSHPYLDVNGDYLISPVGDVLTLVNYLNNLPAAEGEGGAEALATSGDGLPIDLPTEKTPLANEALEPTSPELVELADGADLLASTAGIASPAVESSVDASPDETTEELLSVLADDVAAFWN